MNKKFNNEYREPKTVELEDVVKIVNDQYSKFLYDEGGVIAINFTMDGETETVHLYTNHPGKVIGIGGEIIKTLEEKLKGLGNDDIRVRVHDVNSVKRIMDILEGRIEDDSDLRRGRER